MAGFSLETLERKGNHIFTVSKGNQWLILYPAKPSFKNEGKIKTFPNKLYWENILTELPNKTY